MKKIDGTEELPLLGYMRFNGADYKPNRDDGRLGAQIQKIFTLMQDGIWRTLPQIETQTGYPQASISAQLRHLRKERFGGHIVERRYIENGLYEYCLIVNKKGRHKDGP
jgi:hypothetical protein